MNLKECKELLTKLIRASMDGKYPKQAIYIEGAVGVGKSEMLKQISQELGVNFIDLRLTLLDPTDLRGLIWTEKSEDKGEPDRTKWLPPTFLPYSKRDGEKGILFLDEMPTAPVSVQQASYQLLLPPHQLGEWKLPEGWVVLAAGNASTDKAMVHAMPSPLVNRLFKITIEPNFMDWKEYELQRGCPPEIIYFLWKGGGMEHFSGEPGPEPFPSPRAWERLGEALKVAGYDHPQLYDIIAGFVGKGVAGEFKAWIDLRTKIPDPDEIMAGKDLITTDMSAMYALVGALLTRFREAPKKHADRLLDYSLKIPELYKEKAKKAGYKEYAAILVRDAFMMGKDGDSLFRKAITSSKKYAEWIKEFKDIVI